MIVAAVLVMAAVPSQLGIADGQCRPNEPGPAVVVTAIGLKDRKGRIRLELYPDSDPEFLEDDAVLVKAGKTFRRTDIAVPATGPVELCVRAPHAGSYALSLVHERSGGRKFHLSSDGIGFPGDPKLGFSKPKAAAARVAIGDGVTHINIRLNYRHGLFSFAPVED